MRVGCCGSVDQAAMLKEAGFDFLEVNAQTTLRGELEDHAWQAQAIDPAKVALPIEAANMLLPGTLAVVGPQRDRHALSQYMQRAARRAGRLGIRRLVFGSGNARRCPDGFDQAVAAQQIVEFCRLAGDACAGEGVLFVVEQLHRDETNMIYTLAEEKSLLEEVDHPCVAAAVDNYHYSLEGETDQALLDLGSAIQHVHVAEVAGRRQPGAHDNTAEGSPYDFIHFFTLLRKVGYNERISVEARWTGDRAKTSPACAQFLRQTWQNAKEM